MIKRCFIAGLMVSLPMFGAFYLLGLDPLAGQLVGLAMVAHAELIKMKQ